MKLLALFALLAVAGSASATNNDEGGCRGNCSPDPQVAPASYDQDQGQSQGQAQSATAVAGAFNANDIDVRNANTNVVGVSTSDYNSNSNRAEGGTGIGVGGHQSQGISDSGNSASLSSARGGDQSQSQGVYGSGNSTATNQGNNAAQSTNVTFEAAKSYRHTASMPAPNMYSANSCAQGYGIGLTGPGFGLSGGASKIDPGCRILENARILSGLDSELALIYLCTNPGLDIGKVLGDQCKPKVVLVVPETPDEPEVPVVVIVDEVQG